MPLCIVKNCKNRTISRPILGKKQERNINISYHRFPKNEKTKKLWSDILGLNAASIPVGSRICSAHFPEDAFDVSGDRRRLRPNVVPYIEPVVETIISNDEPSTITTTATKIDRATSPIPGCSHFVTRSTSVSPKRKYNSPEKQSLREKLRDTKDYYCKRVKVLQQNIRRKESRIISLETILDSLKKNNILGAEELQILQDVGGANY